LSQNDKEGLERKRHTKVRNKPKYFERREEPAGTPPGTLLPPKIPRKEKVRITVIDFTRDDHTEFEAGSVEDCAKYKDTESVTWINIDGVDDVDILMKVGEYFGVHHLALEDIQDVGQRPKLEEYDDFYLIVLKLMEYDQVMHSEQISMLLGKKYVITVQERVGDCFDPIRERLRKNKGRIRSMGPDYLAYAIMDVITDELYPILERFGDRLEKMENAIVKDPDPKMLQVILQAKRDMLLLRRSIWPHRGILTKLMGEAVIIVQSDTKRYLRDCYDHTVQVIDMAETYRDLSSGLQDLYMSSISNRMNEVMKVLTIIATIFIPLSFIVGLYGMNFNPASGPFNMPELNWPYGYLFSWAIMIGMVTVMLIYFKRKKWL
jgi:magnesium transporter